MPIDADRLVAQSHRSADIPRLARAAVVPEAMIATEPGLRETPVFDPASQPCAPPRWRDANSGAAVLLIVSLCGVLAVVAAVVVVNAVNHWWALVPGMLISLIAAVCVLATAIRMLGDGD